MTKSRANSGGDAGKLPSEQTFTLNSEPITGGPILEPEVDEAALKRAVSAEDLAATLSRWQVLDIVHVHREGRLQLSATQNPCAPLRKLIDLEIFKRPYRGDSVVDYIVPAHRFRPVLEALWRSGRVRRPEVAQ